MQNKEQKRTSCGNNNNCIKSDDYFKRKIISTLGIYAQFKKKLIYLCSTIHSDINDICV